VKGPAAPPGPFASCAPQTIGNDAPWSELRAWRRDFHRHPQFGFEERRTSPFVAEPLRAFRFIEVTEGAGCAGIVATLKRFGSIRVIVLRADMDHGLPLKPRSRGGAAKDVQVSDLVARVTGLPPFPPTPRPTPMTSTPPSPLPGPPPSSQTIHPAPASCRSTKRSTGNAI